MSGSRSIPRRSGTQLRWARLASAITAMLAAISALTVTPSSGAPASLQPLLERSILVDGVQREYWVYVPEDFAEFRRYDPKDLPLVVILHPDGMDGEAYAQQSAWTRLAEERNFIAVFPSADTGQWHAGRDAAGMHDDAQFVEDVTDAARTEWKSFEVFTYIVGEGSGAAVANTIAATEAVKYAGVASLGGAAPSTLWHDPEAGLDSTHMAIWQVVVGQRPNAHEAAQIKYWKQQNGVAGRTTTSAGFGRGPTYVSKNPDNALAQVRLTHVRKTSDLRTLAVVRAVYDVLFRPTLRFADRDSTVGTLVRYQSARDLGLREYRATLAGYERRWYVYLPKRYKWLTRHGAELPVVFAFHGRNGSSRYVAQQTQWDGVAEDRGFIAVFPQSDPPPGTSPTANLGFSGSLDPANGDVAMTLGILDDLDRRFAVDSRRVFLTGTSQGAAFTNRLAVQYPERFAGIAPCYSGHLSASGYQDTTVVRRDVPLPVWQCRGQNELPTDFPGGTAGETAARAFWRETVNHHAEPPQTEVDGRYTTEVFTDGEADYRWTLVGDIGHFMPRGLSYKIWDEMFAHYERGPNGSLHRR
jgi:poly(3-hydroxybutyrate) depolymerase